jgi:type II secretory pathway pseudopilin PulG
VNARHSSKRQAGASLMEVLVAMSLSLVVTASMIALMSNSLGSTARIIKMTKLADDMRVAMQMMTRDLRRSSYNANAVLCYGNEDCAADGSITAAGDVTIVDGSCFWFEMDRGEGAGAFNGDSTDDPAGGFRHRSAVVDGNQVGWVEMYTGPGDANCAAADGTEGWIAITDPDSINITAFTVDDSLSYTEVVLQDVNGNTMSQRVRKIRMALNGQLVMDPTVVRRMEDVISVRNDLMIL